MDIKYSNNRLKRVFDDYKLMQREITPSWVRTIKKSIDRLKAAVVFGDFLSLGLGKPEQLSATGECIKYSLHITGNVRLIINLNASKETVLSCSEIEIEGVCDYHDGKENWYLS